MCQHGDTVIVEITQRIRVDQCIADEIFWLNANGVRTEGCCCGHGKREADAVITPGSVQRANELGYNAEYVESSGFYRILLKGRDGCSPTRR